MTSNNSILVFYDGECVLCNKSIIWFIKNDTKNILKFSHFKSKFVLKKHKNVSKIEAVSIRDDNGNYLNRSDAILYLLKKLNKYKFLRILGSLTPKFIRDSIYNFIAKNRYKWFGKYESCLIPDDKIKSKFI